jgi:hypothetical protein
VQFQSIVSFHGDAYADRDLPPTDTATLTPSPTRTRTPSPTKIIGIEEPVTIRQATLQFRQALRRKEFRCGDQTDPAENPDTQEYLVLVANVISGPVINKDRETRDWVMNNQIQLLEVVDNNDNYSDFINLGYAIDSSTNTHIHVTVAFLVDMAAKSFVLILPNDIEIPLDDILEVPVWFEPGGLLLDFYWNIPDGRTGRSFNFPLHKKRRAWKIKRGVFDIAESEGIVQAGLFERFSALRQMARSRPEKRAPWMGARKRQ